MTPAEVAATFPPIPDHVADHVAQLLEVPAGERSA